MMTGIETAKFPRFEDISKNLDTDITKHQPKNGNGDNNCLLAEEGVDDRTCAVWHMVRRMSVDQDLEDEANNAGKLPRFVKSIVA